METVTIIVVALMFLPVCLAGIVGLLMMAGRRHE
jgi:hypothetical protein